MNYSVIITAGGTGSRVGFSYNKILHEICGKKVIDYSINYFVNDPKCIQIICVVNKNDYNTISKLYQDMQVEIVIGGKSRQESVYNGLNKVQSDYVLIHDAARPYINDTSISSLLSNLIQEKAISLAVPVTDTIVQHRGNRYNKGFDRDSLLAIQTPQGFETKLIRKCHELAMKNNYQATDDTDLVARFSDVAPYYVMGDNRSIKMTNENDIELLKVILCSE